jgi:hypothetical protein
MGRKSKTSIELKLKTIIYWVSQHKIRPTTSKNG